MEQLEREVTEGRHAASSSERAYESKIQAYGDESSTLRAKLSAALAENDALAADLRALKAENRRKEESLLRTETAFAAAERDHVRTQEDLRATLNRSTLLQASDADMRDQVQQKSNHIDGLRNTLAIVQEQLSHKDAAIARLQAELAAKSAELSEVTERADRHERKLQDKLSYHKEKERTLASDLEHLHRYVGKREVEVIKLADTLADRETTLLEMSPILESTRRANKLLQLRQEREEAERLEALARFRAKQSLKY